LTHSTITRSEATAATAHIVTADGTLVTRDLSHALLPGVLISAET
jgi:D-alanine transaminase